MSKWMDLSINANKIRQSYFKGFIDISGGGVYLRNDLSMNFFDSANSSQPKFSIKSDSIQIRDSTGTYYTISNEKLLFIKDLTQNVETKINDLTGRTQYITSSGTDVSYVNISKNLVVSGDATFNNGLTTVTKDNADNSTSVATTEFVKNQGYAVKDTTVLTGTTTIQTATVNQKLFVTGDTSLNSKLFVFSTSTLNNKLFVAGDVSLNSKLFVAGDVSLNSNVNIGGVLTTTTQSNSDSSTKVATTAFVKNQGYAQLTGANFIGDISLNTRLFIGGDASLNSNLFIAGDVSLNGNMKLNGNLLTVTQTNSDNSTRVATTAFVKNQGYSTIESPTFTGTVTMPQTNITNMVVSDASVNGNLYAVTQSISDNSIKVATTAFVKNQGYSTVESPTFTGTVTIPTANVSKLLISGDASLNSRLYVVGDVSLNSNVDVGGILTTATQGNSDNSTRVATTAFVKNQGYAQLTGANFTGDVATSSRLYVTGDTSLNGKLNVTGEAIFDSDVTVPTQNTNDSSTKVATTAYVKNQGYSKLVSPQFTGVPTAPTPTIGTNTSQIATTQYVRTEIYSFVNTIPDLAASISQLSDALKNTDASFATTLAASVGLKADKESPTFTGIANLPTTIINDTLTAYGETTIDNNLIVTYDLSVNGIIKTSTPLVSDNSTKVATTSYVQNQGYAKLSGATFTGDLAVNTKITSTGDATFNNRLFIGSDASLNANLYVSGTTTLSDNVNIVKHLTVSDVSINGNLLVVGNLNAATQSSTENSTKVATTAFVQNQGYAKLSGAIFTGDVSFNNNVSVSGNSVLNHLAVNNDSSLNANLAVGGNITTNGNLIVGKSIYEKGVSLESKYAPIASPTFTGTVSGITKSMIDLSNVDNTSDINKPISNATQTALDLKANIASPNFTGTTTMAAATISNNISVLGDISLNGNLNLNGNLTAVTVDTNDNSTFVATTAFVKNQGYAKLTGASFTGDISTTSKLTVTGDASMNSKVTFVGDASMNSKVTFAGDVSMNSKVTFDGEVALNGTTTTTTQLTADNSKKIATTEYVKNQNYATIQSPAFTGVPTAPTVNTTATTSNQIATTKYVENKITEFYSAASTETITALNQLSSALKDTDTSFATALANQLTLKADIQSPTFNGLVSLPMTNISENLHVDGDLSMNGTLYVDGPVYEYGTLLSSKYAPIASPAFTGTVTGITKSMVNLSNVDNTSDVDKPISTATQSALDLKANIASPSFTGRISTTGNAVITQNITVGGNGAIIGNLIVSKSIYENGSSLSSVYAPIASPTFTGIVSGITKSMIDLSNVDNTSDANKPISTATQTALDLKANITSPNFIGNVSISKNLLLTGDASFNGKLFVSGDVSLNGNVTGVTQNANDNSTKIATTAFVKSQNQAYAQLTGANFTGDISLNARLFVGSDVSMNSKLFVSSDVSLNSRLNVANDVTINKRLFVKNDVSMNGSLYVTSSIYEKGVALESKYATTEAPSFTGTTTVERIDVTLELLVNADSKLYGKLDVTDDVTMSKNLQVSQSIYENGTALSSKYATLASPTFTGTVSGITKSMIDLSNVDNTSDANKPVSTATQTALDLKANIASPTFTGTPIAPTASSGTNTTQIATTAFVKGEINNLVDNAPDGLNTLKELALAINNDASFSNTIATNLELKSNIASPTFTGIVTIGTLNITNDLSLNSNLVVGGDVSLNGNLYANFPNSSIPSTAIKNLYNDYGQLEIQCQRADIVTFDEEGFETSRYAGSGGFIETLYARNSDLSLNGNIYINGNGVSVISTDTSLNGNVNIGKNVFISQDVSINNNLDLSGSLIAHNNVNVYGIINQYTVSLDQGYIVNYANSETTIESLQAQITTLQQQLANVLQILSNNNIQ